MSETEDQYEEGDNHLESKDFGKSTTIARIKKKQFIKNSIEYLSLYRLLLYPPMATNQKLLCPYWDYLHGDPSMMTFISSWLKNTKPYEPSKMEKWEVEISQSVSKVFFETFQWNRPALMEEANSIAERWGDDLPIMFPFTVRVNRSVIKLDDDELLIRTREAVIVLAALEKSQKKNKRFLEHISKVKQSLLEDEDFVSQRTLLSFYFKECRNTFLVVNDSMEKETQQKEQSGQLVDLDSSFYSDGDGRYNYLYIRKRGSGKRGGRGRGRGRGRGGKQEGGLTREQLEQEKIIKQMPLPATITGKKENKGKEVKQRDNNSVKGDRNELGPGKRINVKSTDNPYLDRILKTDKEKVTKKKDDDDKLTILLERLVQAQVRADEKMQIIADKLEVQDRGRLKEPSNSKDPSGKSPNRSASGSQNSKNSMFNQSKV